MKRFHLVYPETQQIIIIICVIIITVVVTIKYEDLCKLDNKYNSLTKCNV
jgi:hypothetical protein